MIGNLELHTYYTIHFFYCILFSEQYDVCKGCYQVIKSYLKGNSRKNENYLTRFIKFFKTQVGLGLNVEEVMVEMVEDNR